MLLMNDDSFSSSSVEFYMCCFILSALAVSQLWMIIVNTRQIVPEKLSFSFFMNYVEVCKNMTWYIVYTF